MITALLVIVSAVILLYLGWAFVMRDDAPVRNSRYPHSVLMFRAVP